VTNRNGKSMTQNIETVIAYEVIHQHSVVAHQIRKAEAGTIIPSDKHGSIFEC